VLPDENSPPEGNEIRLNTHKQQRVSTTRGYTEGVRITHVHIRM
jgi:hypothetical protein